MTTLLEFVAVFGLSAIAGSVLHEGCHWTAAALLGAGPSFDVWDWSVCYRADGLSDAQEAVVLAAPYVYGTMLLVAIVATGAYQTAAVLPTLGFFVGLFTPSKDDFLLSSRAHASGSSTSS